MSNTRDGASGGEQRDSGTGRGSESEQLDEGLSMNELNTALPSYGSPQPFNQQFSGPRPDATYLQSQQLAGQAQASNFQSSYPAGYTPQIQQYNYQNQAHRPPTNPPQPQYHGQQIYQGQQPMFYQQYTPTPQYYTGGQRLHDGMMGRGYPPPMPQAVSPTWNHFPGDPMSPQMSIARPIPSTIRGPPRKPKQSGHALWVGNLPPGALVNDLKDHFSRDATNDIESVFLISKSNCAFVNYKTDQACAAAMARFHDSRFFGVRLVCRLRRTSTVTMGSPTGIPTAPAAISSTAASAEGQTAIEAVTRNREESTRADAANKSVAGADKINDKYFVVKSLTVEDLELSARNGIWATQAHNEETLNKAYESVDNVYLIFSANKSGEYFGYARMVSPINEESAATLEWKPRVEAPVVDDPDLPRSIPTPATETAPKGRIIDDSARGTIFWEAETSFDDEATAATGESEPANDPESSTTSPDPSPEAGTSPDPGSQDANTPSPIPGTQLQQQQQQPYGHPFRIQWLSTSRLPFYRTRGLRNPWNSNREVKIARDGTELETGVGRRLISLFATLPQQQQMQQYSGVDGGGGGIMQSAGGPVLGASPQRQHGGVGTQYQQHPQQTFPPQQRY